MSDVCMCVDYKCVSMCQHLSLCVFAHDLCRSIGTIELWLIVSSSLLVNL